MNAIERIKSQLASAPVVLYMKGTPDFPQCGFSAQTVGALRACKAEFAHVNIFEDPEVRDALKTYLQLADVPAALCERRADRRLRHRSSKCTRAASCKQLLAEAGAVPAA